MAISTIGTDALASAAVTSAKLASGAPSRSQLPAGTVLQVLQNVQTGDISTTDTVNYTTICTVTITPTSASSKFLLFGVVGEPDIETGYVHSRIFRDSTAVLSVSTEMGRGIPNTSESHYPSLCGAYLDSPATASAITYTLKFKAVISGTARINNGAASSLTVMEIAA